VIWTGVYLHADATALRAGSPWAAGARAGALELLRGRLLAQGVSLTDEATRRSVERAQAGDPEAFAELFAAHADDVARVCRRMLGGSDAAQDAESEVFLRARRALATYDAARPFRPWLLSIAGNHCIDQLRRLAREARVFSDAPAQEADLGAPGPSPLSRLVAAEAHDAISLAIEGLPLRYRLPLLLRYFGDYDYAAIAEVLGVSKNQVGSLLFRAKRLVREQVEVAGRNEGTQ
jgi:RNA polymerase sigma factor (sigma-70 family)